MSGSLATVSYIGATILFILCLGGLSNQETARRGNLYGMIGMTIAVLATVFGPKVTPGGYAWIIGAMAVGGAIGRNPLSIVVPCHRVIGASGALTGYAGGVERKAFLLDHESPDHLL